jgi:uncharacterized protein YbjT (DUF2867 family)
MEIAVVGGTGTFGAALTAELAVRGHAVRILSRRAPSHGAAQHRRVDLETGAGLVAALNGVEVVVNAANDTGRGAAALLVGGTRRLLTAAAEADVPHHALISIVGIDDVPSAYLRTKVEQEQLMRESDGAWSILRATQFHQLVDHAFAAMARVGLSPRSRIELQPVDPREVAVAMADAIEGGPWGEGREVAGPEVRTISELARIWTRATRRRRLPLPVPLVGSAASAARRGALTAPEASGRLGFAHWLAEQRRDTPAPGPLVTRAAV